MNASINLLEQLYRAVKNIYSNIVDIIFSWGRFAAQMFGFKGIDYSSPTMASAMSNLTPAFTFALAILFRFFSSLLISFFPVKHKKEKRASEGSSGMESVEYLIGKAVEVQSALVKLRKN